MRARSTGNAKAERLHSSAALAFAYVENILNSADNMLAASSALSVLEATVPQLEIVGFQRLVFEDFYDCLAGLINQVINPVDNRLLTIDLLLEAFNSPEGEDTFGSCSQSWDVIYDCASYSYCSLQLYRRVPALADIGRDQDEPGLRRIPPAS